MKVFPGSEQKSDNISPPKHDFETSLKIQIRHGSDNEWEYCTYNKKTLFNFFLQFFKALERTLSSSFDSRNAWKWKQGHYTKRRKKKKKRASVLHPRAHMFTQLQRGEQRRHGDSSFKPSCQQLKSVWFALYVSLTLLFASLSAPAPNNSCTVAVWPLREASIRAVSLYFINRGRGRHTP